MRLAFLFLLTGCVVEGNSHRGEDTASTADSGGETSVPEACQGSEPVQTLTCGEISGEISVDTHSNDRGAYSCNEYGSGPEQVFAFTCPGEGEVVVAMRPTCDLDLVLLDESCDPNSCVDASLEADDTIEGVYLPCTAGARFYVVLEGYGVGDAEFCGDSGGYTIEVYGEGC